MQSRKPEQRDLDYAKAVLELYDVRAAESARRARAGMFQRVGAPAQVIFVMEWLSWADFNRWLQATFDLPSEIEMGVDRRTLVRAVDANGTKNPPPNRAVEQRIKEENSLDTELYAWAPSDCDRRLKLGRTTEPPRKSSKRIGFQRLRCGGRQARPKRRGTAGGIGRPTNPGHPWLCQTPRPTRPRCPFASPAGGDHIGPPQTPSPPTNDPPWQVPRCPAHESVSQRSIACLPMDLVHAEL